jgi:hypothetical protein
MTELVTFRCLVPDADGARHDVERLQQLGEATGGDLPSFSTRPEDWKFSCLGEGLRRGRRFSRNNPGCVSPATGTRKSTPEDRARVSGSNAGILPKRRRGRGDAYVSQCRQVSRHPILDLSAVRAEEVLPFAADSDEVCRPGETPLAVRRPLNPTSVLRSAMTGPAPSRQPSLARARFHQGAAR